MHIGFVCNEYPPALHGGIGSYTKDLSRGLVLLGHRVTVVGVYDPKVQAVDSVEDCMEDGVRVVRLPPVRTRSARLRIIAERRRLYSWLAVAHREHPFDLIEFPDFAGWLPAGAPAGIPSVVRLHGSTLLLNHVLHRRASRLLATAERFGIRAADYVASVSRFTGALTMELCGTPARSFNVIYNAIDTKTFSPDPAVAREPGLIVYTGSISPKKGVGELCLAMNQVLREFPEARLVLVGKYPPSGVDTRSYPDELLETIAPELRARVVFRGALPRETGVLHHLRRASVCCFPSRVEAFGLTPIEAMSVGCPTIFTRAASGPEIIEDGISGLLCNPSSPDDIANKLLSILRDAEFADRLGREGRRRVLEYFDTGDWVARNLEFYSQAVTGESQGEGAPGNRITETAVPAP